MKLSNNWCFDIATTSANAITSYKHTQSIVIANTTTPTSMFVSDPIIPANSLKVGDSFLINIFGIISNTGTPDSTLSVKIGNTTIMTNTTTMSNLTGNYMSNIKILLTVRSIGINGSIIGQGFSTIVKDATPQSNGLNRGLSMSAPVTINTTIDNALSILYAWGTASASNTTTVTNALVEKITS